MPRLLDQARYGSTRGRSIRDRQEPVSVRFGQMRSREAVGSVTRAARSPMAAWRTRRMTDTPPMLIVAGVWGPVLAPTGATGIDQSGHARREMRGQDQGILTVMGVWEAGRHPIIPSQAAAAEATAAWSDLRRALIGRGVDAAAVQLGVSAGSTGLPSALAAQLPKAQQQRGGVHTIRGLERACCDRDLTMIDPVTQAPRTDEAARRVRRQHRSSAAHAIFAAPTRAEAVARLAQFRTTWGPREPEVVRRLRRAVDTCLTVYQFDHALHALVRSTNLLERFFRAFRTKSDAIGAVPNELRCLVVFHLVVIRDDAKHDRGQTAKTG